MESQKIYIYITTYWSLNSFSESEMKLEEENWDIRYNRFCPMDLGLFQALERERVLEVLQRDKALRTIEADRIRSENVLVLILLLCKKYI